MHVVNSIIIFILSIACILLMHKNKNLETNIDELIIYHKQVDKLYTNAKYHYNILAKEKQKKFKTDCSPVYTKLSNVELAYKDAISIIQMLDLDGRYNHRVFNLNTIVQQNTTD